MTDCKDFVSITGNTLFSFIKDSVGSEEKDYTDEFILVGL
jgi:hypothetical protein